MNHNIYMHLVLSFWVDLLESSSRVPNLKGVKECKTMDSNNSKEWCPQISSIAAIVNNLFAETEDRR